MSSPNIQQGSTATVKLKFTNADGTPAPVPSSGGHISINNGNIGSVTMVDQGTVGFSAIGTGSGTLSYSGNGLTATDIVTVVATTATQAAFDDTSWVVTPPVGS
jgi:hypothetical protein